MTLDRAEALAAHCEAMGFPQAARAIRTTTNPGWCQGCADRGSEIARLNARIDELVNSLRDPARSASQP